MKLQPNNQSPAKRDFLRLVPFNWHLEIGSWKFTKTPYSYACPR